MLMMLVCSEQKVWSEQLLVIYTVSLFSVLNYLLEEKTTIAIVGLYGW